MQRIENCWREVSDSSNGLGSGGGRAGVGSVLGTCIGVEGHGLADTGSEGDDEREVEGSGHDASGEVAPDTLDDDAGDHGRTLQRVQDKVDCTAPQAVNTGQNATVPSPGWKKNCMPCVCAPSLLTALVTTDGRQALNTCMPEAELIHRGKRHLEDDVDLLHDHIYKNSWWHSVVIAQEICYREICGAAAGNLALLMMQAKEESHAISGSHLRTIEVLNNGVADRMCTAACCHAQAFHKLTLFGEDRV